MYRQQKRKRINAEVGEKTGRTDNLQWFGQPPWIYYTIYDIKCKNISIGSMSRKLFDLTTSSVPYRICECLRCHKQVSFANTQLLQRRF